MSKVTSSFWYYLLITLGGLAAVGVLASIVFMMTSLQYDKTWHRPVYIIVGILAILAYIILIPIVGVAMGVVTA